MNLETFYEEIKTALAAFGLPWSAKEDVLVSIDGARVVFSYGYAVYAITLPLE